MLHIQETKYCILYSQSKKQKEISGFTALFSALSTALYSAVNHAKMPQLTKVLILFLWISLKYNWLG